MRSLLYLLALAMLWPLAASADPRDKSLRLYVEMAPIFTKLVDTLEMAGEPVETADRIKADVSEPLDASRQAWLDGMLGDDRGSEAYRPFAACYESADALADFANKAQRYLRGIDREPWAIADAAPFRAKLGDCEAALDLPKTFP